MHQSIPPAPIPPPTGWPPGISIFFTLDGKFPGVGTLELSNPPGWGRKKRANAPFFVNTATFLPFCLFLQMPHPRDWHGGQMPRSGPGGRGGGLGAGGIDWCITEQHILTTTDQSFPYQKAIKAYAYVITRRQYLINNFNLFSDFIFSDNGC